MARGEVAFLEKKQELFWQSVCDNPLDFVDRVHNRFISITLWYTAFYRNEEAFNPIVLWWCRLVYPLPFVAFVVLLYASISERTHSFQRIVICVYCLYLFPYVIIGYYVRYALPLLGIKVLLVVWATDWLVLQLKGLRLVSPRH